VPTVPDVLRGRDGPTQRAAWHYAAIDVARSVRASNRIPEVGVGKGTLLQFDYDHPPKPPKPNRFWHVGKLVFNKTYWHTVPRGRV
jgi:hypothetical protein